MHTSSLESGDSCKTWLTFDGGSTWVEPSIWIHQGPGEITGWDAQYVLGGSLDNSTQVGFKYGTGQASGKRDFCWIDSAKVTCVYH